MKKKQNAKPQPMMRGPVKSNKMTVSYDDLVGFVPYTSSQELALNAWNDKDHLVLTGTAGTGKTFIALALAFQQLLEEQSEYEKVVIIRSIVATRDPGHLPGTKQEKEEAFSSPYKALCNELFTNEGSYGKLVSSKKLEFESTSFIRGITWNNSIIVVDEMQNLNFHELDTVITRVGQNSRIIFSGDYKQTDFKHHDEKEGILKFIDIIEHMNNFTIVNFTWADIVRSDFVRDYIMTKEMLGY